VKTASQVAYRYLSADEGEAWCGDWGARAVCAMRDIRRIELLRGGVGIQQADIEPSPLLEKALLQLGEYLCGRRREFDLPLWHDGSPFYRQVWDALAKVPFGSTLTYGELAAAAGNAKAVRAVGGAMGANALPLLIPCHRVVASGGKLGGFAYGPAWKKWLLELERPELSFD
jgi:methylated-DNA-[protein]-cysteine S-methyltransferase